MPIHAVTDYLSLLVGFQLYVYLNKNPVAFGARRYAYICATLVGALVMSRVLALLEHPTLLASGTSLLLLLGNKTIIGAIIGGIIGYEIVKKIYGVKRWTGDDIVLPLMIAIIIGRIGCQLTGVADGTIGVPCSLLWCFAQGDGIPRHPLPLYEITALLIALPFTYRAYVRKFFPEGTLFRLVIIGYFMLRFFLEFLKDEPHILFSLTAIQIACLAVSSLYLYDVRGLFVSLIRRIRKHKETPSVT